MTAANDGSSGVAPPEPGDVITIEVAYALPDRQQIKEISVPSGTTALDAAVKARLEESFDDVEIGPDTKLGVFGKSVSHDHVLSAGERVEIYRPLKIDPKEVRKQRAAKAKAKREDEAASE